MKDTAQQIQDYFRKLDFMAIAMGFVLMLVLAITITLVVGAIVALGTSSDNSKPFQWHPSITSGLIGSALVAICSFSGGFLTSRKAKSAPVLNALFMPALETIRKFLVLAVNVALDHPISTISYPLWLSMTDLAVFIGFSYMGAIIALRLRAKSRTAI